MSKAPATVTKAKPMKKPLHIARTRSPAVNEKNTADISKLLKPAPDMVTDQPVFESASSTPARTPSSKVSVLKILEGELREQKNMFKKHRPLDISVDSTKMLRDANRIHLVELAIEDYKRQNKDFGKIDPRDNVHTLIQLWGYAGDGLFSQSPNGQPSRYETYLRLIYGIDQGRAKAFADCFKRDYLNSVGFLVLDLTAVEFHIVVCEWEKKEKGIFLHNVQKFFPDAKDVPAAKSTPTTPDEGFGDLKKFLATTNLIRKAALDEATRRELFSCWTVTEIYTFNCWTV